MINAGTSVLVLYHCGDPSPVGLILSRSTIHKSKTTCTYGWDTPGQIICSSSDTSGKLVCSALQCMSLMLSPFSSIMGCIAIDFSNVMLDKGKCSHIPGAREQTSQWYVSILSLCILLFSVRE